MGLVIGLLLCLGVGWDLGVINRRREGQKRPEGQRDRADAEAMTARERDGR